MTKETVDLSHAVKSFNLSVLENCAVESHFKKRSLTNIPENWTLLCFAHSEETTEESALLALWIIIAPLSSLFWFVLPASLLFWMISDKPSVHYLLGTEQQLSKLDKVVFVLLRRTGWKSWRWWPAIPFQNKSSCRTNRDRRVKNCSTAPLVVRRTLRHALIMTVQHMLLSPTFGVAKHVYLFKSKGPHFKNAWGTTWTCLK